MHARTCQCEIDYNPLKYNEQVICDSCDGVFGFKLYPVGPRIEAALRDEVMQRQQRRQQQRSALASRSARAPPPSLSEEQRKRQAEHLFSVGLRDSCPRCGHAPDSQSEGEKLEKERRRHSRDCVDAVAHAKFARKQRKTDERESARAAMAAADDELQNVAAWKLLGANAAAAWMLTDKALEETCAEKGIDTSGGREAQLQRLAAKEREAAAAEGGGDEAAPLLTSASAPANLHALSLVQLRGVCAAHGLSPPGGLFR